MLREEIKIVILDEGTETCKLIEDGIKRTSFDVKLKVDSLIVPRSEGFKLESGYGIREYLGEPQQVALSPTIEDTDILLVHLAPVTKQALSKARRLKYIGCARSNAVNVDVNAATSRGIPVVSCPGRNARAVAEFTMGLLLDVTRHITFGHQTVIRSDWDENMDRTRFRGPELEGRVLGIIGYGMIGRMVAKLAIAFGLEVVFFDPFVTTGDDIAKYVPLRELLKVSDFVTLHARGSQSESGSPVPIIGSDELKLMKSSAVLINTARGHLVDESALLLALKEEQIAGAALDTFQAEPIPEDSLLLTAPNLILTPHIGGNSSDQGRQSAQMVVSRLEYYLKQGIKGIPGLENPDVMEVV